MILGFIKNKIWKCLPVITENFAAEASDGPLGAPCVVEDGLVLCGHKGVSDIVSLLKTVRWSDL